MVHVDIDDELYDKIKRIVGLSEGEYPSINFFVNKKIKEIIGE